MANIFTNIRDWFFQLAKVTPIQPGKKNDGLVINSTAGTSLDKMWIEHHNELSDARYAWRSNPMVRRFVGLVTSYVVGQGMSLYSEKKVFNKFIEDFWNHPQNMMDNRVAEWSDELTRAGELFPLLYTNPIDGMSYVRIVPADIIEDVDYLDGDYETELRYRETTGPGEPEKWWVGPNHESAFDKKADGHLHPWMLHYAINRPVGCVRGEGDLVPILPWLKRYEGWLKDRVSLNAAMRSFYWIVYATGRLKGELVKKYRRPPASGSVIVAEKDSEEWQAVTPNLNAKDAKEDGRAIRWMIAAGGPGTGLGDFGEGEESGLTKGKDSDELRRRFLLRRQTYLTFILSDMVCQAFRRYQAVKEGRKYGRTVVDDVIVKAPDISAEDNAALALASKDLVVAMTDLRGFMGDTEELRRFGLRMFVKFSGESMTDDEFAAIMEGDPVADVESFAPPFPPNQLGDGTAAPSGEKSKGKDSQRPKKETPKKRSSDKPRV
jgi:hypothetical protein